MIRSSMIAAVLLFATACSTTVTPPADPETSKPPVVLRLEEALRDDPANGAAIYILARFHAEGQPDESIALLEQLRDIGWNYALDDRDFEPLAGRDDYREIAAVLASREPDAGDSELAFELEMEDVHSEGMEWDETRELFYLGSAELRKVVVVGHDGAVVDRLPRGDELLLAPLGMEVDHSRDLLWVASAAAPFMAGYESSLEGRSLLVAIDLTNGSVASRFETGSREDPSLLNDLTILPDGRVAVTDSQRSAIWLVDVKRNVIEPLAGPDEVWAPNGIAPSPDGRSLIVATFPGLFRVDVATGAVAEIATPAGVRLNGIDGLDHDGHELIGIQNLVGRVRIWRLTLDETSSRVSARIIESGDDTLENPTTGAIAGADYYYMANPGVGTGRIRMMRLERVKSEG